MINWRKTAQILNEAESRVAEFASGKLHAFKKTTVSRATVAALEDLSGFLNSKSQSRRLAACVAFLAGTALAPLLWAVTAPDSMSETSRTEPATEPQTEFLQVATADLTMAALAPIDTTPSSRPTLVDASHLQAYRPAIDSAVEGIYRALSNNDLDQALSTVDQLLEEYPNFSLGHLLRGDILSLKAGRPVRAIGDIPKLPRSRKDDLVKLREEAVARFKAVKDRPENNMLPSELMVLNETHKYVVLVDTSRSRLFLYENSFPHPRLVTDFYISQGKKGAVKEREGDKRTPIGVYTITELLPKEKLSDFYGPIALPIDYPNRWDKRLGKTGYGIWLHGMPSEYVSRPPKDSDGCVVLANQDLLALRDFIDIGTTQVIISETLDFVPVDLWQVQRRTALRAIKTWKDDLEKGLEKGLVHYSPDVLINGMSLVNWQKENELTTRKFGRIKIENLNVLGYPSSDEEMMHITFEQLDELNGRQKKEQYWMKIGTRWKIIQEESIKL